MFQRFRTKYHQELLKFDKNKENQNASNKNWSVFLDIFQIKIMDCLLFPLFTSTLKRVLEKRKNEDYVTD